MAILKTSILGNPILREKTRRLSVREIQSPEIQRLIDNMVDTMREYDGVGLAATQVHEDKSIVVIECVSDPEKKSKGDIPLTILINPEYTPLTDEMAEGWEGCLSIPEIRGIVPRYKKVHIKAQDRKGKEFEFDGDEFFAVILQHEIDHLSGILFVDRMTDLSTLTFLKEFSRYWAE